MIYHFPWKLDFAKGLLRKDFFFPSYLAKMTPVQFSQALWIISTKWNSDILCISLFQQCTPEFILVHRVHEGQLAVVSRKPVIHHHFHPLSLSPEVETEHSAVAILKTLIWWNNLGKQTLVHCQRGDSSQQPTITYVKQIYRNVDIMFNQSLRNACFLKTLYLPAFCKQCIVSNNANCTIKFKRLTQIRLRFLQESVYSSMLEVHSKILLTWHCVTEV